MSIEVIHDSVWRERQKRAKFVLSEIADLMKGSHDSTDPGYYLWMVLSALRGPDMNVSSTLDPDRLKKATTVKIRAAIGIPKFPYNKAGVDSSDKQPLQSFQTATIGIDGAYESFHFMSHYNEAVRGLRKLGLLDDAPVQSDEQ